MLARTSEMWSGGVHLQGQDVVQFGGFERLPAGSNRILRSSAFELLVLRERRRVGPPIDQTHADAEGEPVRTILMIT